MKFIYNLMKEILFKTEYCIRIYKSYCLLFVAFFLQPNLI